MKTNVKRTLIVLAVLLLAAGAAVAAWSMMKATTGTGLVLGTFTLSSLDCGTAVEEQLAVCSATVTNDYDQVVSVDACTLLADRGDITLFGCEVPGVGFLPQPVAPGGTLTLEAGWKPQAAAPPGVVNFTMEVTASAN